MQEIQITYPASKEIKTVKVIKVYSEHGFNFALHKTNEKPYKYAISEYTGGGRAGYGKTIKEAEELFFTRVRNYATEYWKEIIEKSIKIKNDTVKKINEK